MTRHPFPEIADEAVRVVDWQTMGFPARHGTVSGFKALAKRMWFDSYPDLSDLYSVSAYLCAYGFLARARDLALTLGRIPNGTADVQYSYIHACFTQPCCFLEHYGYTDLAKPLRALALNPPGESFKLGPRALDGSMLRACDSRQELGGLFQNINTLSTMWVLGSTVKGYPRERIGDLLDQTLAELHRRKGWEPWPHPGSPIG